MKRIVVYKMIIVIGALILAKGLAAQKPAIDLISSHQQNRHPEAIIDTGYSANPLFREVILIETPPAENKKMKGESEKKRRRQIGPSLDSLFQKEDNDNIKQEKQPVKISLFNRKYNPIKFLIYITALK
jgi:hypothetical protein